MCLCVWRERKREKDWNTHTHTIHTQRQRKRDRDRTRTRNRHNMASEKLLCILVDISNPPLKYNQDKFLKVNIILKSFALNMLHLPDLVWNLPLAPTVSRAWTQPTGPLAQERPLEELKALEERIQFCFAVTDYSTCWSILFFCYRPFRLFKEACPLFLQSWGSESFLLLQTLLLHSHPLWVSF